MRYLNKTVFVVFPGKSEHHQALFAVLTPDMDKAIRRIRIIKKQFQELDDNKYVFAIRGQKKSHVRGNKAFEYVRNLLGLQNLTAGKIRLLAGTNSAMDADARRKNLYVAPSK